MSADGGGHAPVVLMVAEKPSIASSVAHAVAEEYGAGVASIHGYGHKLPVHEFSGTFMGQRVTFRVTSVAGHVFSTDFPPAYQSWDSVDPISLFSAPVVKTEANKGVVHHLRDVAVGVYYVVLWLDCDREGENICFEVLDIIRPRLSHVRGRQIFRARFSAVAKPDIVRAMKALVEPNENEALAVDARQELDLKVGVAFSRFQTRFFQGKYGNLDSTLISYGPCQTPTLGFCVERFDEIHTFQSEPFWTIEVEIEKSGFRLALEWQRGRLFDQEVARLFESMILETRTCELVALIAAVADTHPIFGS